MSSIPDWSENFLIFQITYDSASVVQDLVYHPCGYSSPHPCENFLIYPITYDLLSDIEVWLHGLEPPIIRRSSLVQQLSVRKDPGPNFAA